MTELAARRAALEQRAQHALEEGVPIPELITAMETRGFTLGLQDGRVRITARSTPGRRERRSAGRVRVVSNGD